MILFTNSSIETSLKPKAPNIIRLQLEDLTLGSVMSEKKKTPSSYLQQKTKCFLKLDSWFGRKSILYFKQKK